MKNKDFYWHGWVPILSGEIFFDYYCMFNLSQFATRIGDEDKEKIDKILSKDGTYYKWLKETDDLSEDKVEIVVSLTAANKVDNVLIFDKDKQLKTQASCEIEKNGIVKIILIVPKDGNYEEEIIQQIYIIIRDIYHSHTHHAKHEDLLLSPVNAIDRKSAISKIVEQYLIKVIEYHKRIRRAIEIEEKIVRTAKLITKSKGEMIYALSFINLFKDEIDNYQALESVFLNANTSMDLLLKEVELHYSSKINEKISTIAVETKYLTIIILIFTVIMTILNIVIIIRP